MFYQKITQKDDFDGEQAPLIGIPVCKVEQNRQFVTDAYVYAVASSGGIPLLLPFCREQNIILSYVKLCDGFLFPGGGDIAPALFGQERQSGCGDTDIMFDRFQIGIMRQVLAARRPVIAICRGMQVLNVACGGSLYQDLALRGRQTNEHMQQTKQRSEPIHRVQLSGGRLEKWFGGWVDTNSYHHQAAARIGRGLPVRGVTSDGVVEALEGQSGFVLGVQWHPEAMFDASEQMRHIFTEFITAAWEFKRCNSSFSGI